MSDSTGQAGPETSKQTQLEFERKRRIAKLRSIKPDALGLSLDAWRTPRELLIQIELTSKADGCHSFVETLAARVAVTGRTIRNARRLLEEKKLLYVDENKHRRGGQGANEWCIQWDVVAAYARGDRPEMISGRPETISDRAEVISGPIRNTERQEESLLESGPPVVPPADSPLTVDELDRIADQRLRQATADWVAYKAERRQGYKALALKALVTRVTNQAATHGAAAVIEAMERAMGSNWQGWDHDVGGKPTKAGAASYKSRTEACFERVLARRSNGNHSTGHEVGRSPVRGLGPPGG